jgi:hypothetical protein
VNEAYVMITDGSKAIKKVVKIGKEYNGLAEIVNGVQEGDLLITAGYDSLNDEDKISLKK